MGCRAVALNMACVLTAVISMRRPNIDLDENVQVRKYNVSLLVTRHGLSCSNIASKWVGYLDAGRANMHDPLLGAVGEHACREAGKTVDEWLQERSLSIDTVLSSVLARAMETAELMYPVKGPLVVAPFIREHASGLSNAPMDPGPQLEALSTVLPGPPEVDYHWVDEFGREEGTWEQFLGFLEQSFLPELLGHTQKPPGSTLVLPVVTHSKFVRDSAVGDRCGDAWTSKGESKPLNNQVVHMPYELVVGSAVGADAAEADPRRPVFTISGCGDAMVNGQYAKTGLKHGRPMYSHMQNSKIMIDWNAQRKAWQLFVDNWWGFSRSTLYFNHRNEPVVPSDGWDYETGNLPVPHIKLRDPHFRLLDSAKKCTEVAPGLNLKDSNGELREPICLKDIGESCIASVLKHSWYPGGLWSKTYDGMIWQTKKEMEASRQKIADTEKRYEDNVRNLETAPDNSTERLATLQAMMKQQQTIKAEHDKIHAWETVWIPGLANSTCWSGGHPDANGRMPGVP